MTTPEPPVFVVGPLRVAGCDVEIRTNDADFAQVATRVFTDLAPSEGAPPATRHVVFDTVRHDESTVRWSVHRDGEPCELELRPDAVLVHQQWELNRLAIESQRCAIHAAAVSIDGQGVLLAGASHSGKSTLAAWLVAEHGAGYIADEVSAIDDQLRVRPFPRPVGLRSDGPLADRATADGWTGHDLLVPASDLGSVVTETTPLGLIVFPLRAADHELAATALSPGDVLVRLAALTPGLQRHGTEVFDRLRRLADTMPGLELHYPDVRMAAPVVQEAQQERRRE